MDLLAWAKVKGNAGMKVGDFKGSLVSIMIPAGSPWDILGKEIQSLN